MIELIGMCTSWGDGRRTVCKSGKMASAPQKGQVREAGEIWFSWRVGKIRMSKWPMVVWSVTPADPAHPGTHTQVHRHMLKWNLCTLGVSVERVWWRLVPEKVQPSFLCVSPLKTWTLKGKTISFLDGEKEAQDIKDSIFLLINRKILVVVWTVVVQTLKMYTLQETGEILRRQPGDGVRGWWETGICGLEPHACQMPLPQDKFYSWELPVWTPDPKRRSSWHGWQKANLAAVRLGAPASLATAPGCGAREALCTGVVACVQAPSDFKRRWPCWYPWVQEEHACLWLQTHLHISEHPFLCPECGGCYS